MDHLEKPKSDISESLKLLNIYKQMDLGGDSRGILLDHFVSLKHGLEFLGIFLAFSENEYLLDCIRKLVAYVKHELYLLKDEKLVKNLDHAFHVLREDMKNLIIKPRSNEYEVIFPEIFTNSNGFEKISSFLCKKIEKLMTSDCKADQMTPTMKDLEELKKKLKLVKPLFDFTMSEFNPFWPSRDEKDFLVSLTAFLDRATCLIYLSIVGKLNEDMLVSMRKNLSSLIEETEISNMSLVLGKISEGLKSDFDTSLSLLERQEEYHKGTIINEDMLKDHIMSLKHGIEFLKRFILIDSLRRSIIQFVGDVKQKLELLSQVQWDESLNMDNVNLAYCNLREEMKNVVISPATNTLIPEFSKSIYHYIRDDDFLLEKITTLVTSNCKADQIAPLKTDLQDLREMLTSLKPLSRYVRCKVRFSSLEDETSTFFTFHHKADFLIYLSFVGKMDSEMVLSVKSNISAAIKETIVSKMYTMILSKHDSDYFEKELYLLQNMILLLKSNVGSLNDANSKLYEVLNDVHSFLLGLSPNVLLRKLHLLQASFEDILVHSIPIICSCYLAHTEVHISAELNCVLDVIKHIKFEAHEMKLYYFPKTDDLRFLEFFSGYLKELMENHEIQEIGDLYFEVHSLLSLAKVELNKFQWPDVINLAYEAEYIIDHYLVSSSRDLELISSLLKIIDQLKKIRADVHGLCCETLPAQDVGTSKPQVLGTTTQVGDNDAIVDLQEDATVMEYLLKGENKLGVISIFGMAGVGKTTLAATLCKTPLVINHFDILAWCTVSQSYQNRDLLLAILDQVSLSDKSHRSILEDQDLADHFCRKLKKRRYLIVLDDIWGTALWNYLKSYLPDDGNGSRILITTRNRENANEIGGKVVELRGLSEEKSWQLFQKKMHANGSLSENLLKISKRIVKHCKGLPLSIVIIAGILSDIERTNEKWNQIATSVSSVILSNSQGKCKAILEVSYNHLPNHLRPCFLYLGSFLEDEEISVDRLVSLWIAEGLVRDTEANRAEEVAQKYIKDLIVRSLVIPAKEGFRGVKTFRLHDLLRDFCLDKAKENHFFTFLDKVNYSRPLHDPRRLIGSFIHGLNFSCHSIRSIRSIRSMIGYRPLHAFQIEVAIKSRDLRLLEVLDVHQFDHFPDISSLIRLRYLAIMSWLRDEISELPSSITKLKNLEFLILAFGLVIKVPDSIWDMVKLKHIDITEAASFEVDINKVEKSSLSKAQVSCDDSKWLTKLSGLQRLSCAFLQYPMDDPHQKLRFSDNLSSLKVDNPLYAEKRFISTCELPVNLRELTFSKFFLQSNDISKIGKRLPHLEVLKIYTCSGPAKWEWNTEDDNFPKLKVLKLSFLKIFSWIASEDAFPSLEQLWVQRCYVLDKIPLDFGYLPKLSLISVRDCAPSIDESAREIEKLQHEEQNWEMKVHIYPKNNSSGEEKLSSGEWLEECCVGAESEMESEEQDQSYFQVTVSCKLAHGNQACDACVTSEDENSSSEKTILTSVVGSHAIISGTFSIINQSQSLGCFPRVKLVHTNEKIHGQVYIPEINSVLMILCIAVTIGFMDTKHTGNASGLAVMAVMMVTTCLTSLVSIRCYMSY